MRIAAAWQARDALVLACPSSQGGHYLVRVVGNEKYLVVTHSCPAAVNGKRCWHIETAVNAYREWRWWEPERQVRTVTKAISLDPKWVQIPVPGTELKEAFGLEHTA